MTFCSIQRENKAAKETSTAFKRVKLKKSNHGEGKCIKDKVFYGNQEGKKLNHGEDKSMKNESFYSIQEG